MVFWDFLRAVTQQAIEADLYTRILVFILSIGYYITPEIVGGTTGVFISNRIAYHISSSLNWRISAVCTLAAPMTLPRVIKGIAISEPKRLSPEPMIR